MKTISSSICILCACLLFQSAFAGSSDFFEDDSELRYASEAWTPKQKYQVGKSYMMKYFASKGKLKHNDRAKLAGAAFNYLCFAADQGFTPAKYQMAMVYAGLLGFHDHNRAVMYLKEAADQKYVPAQNDLEFLQSGADGKYRKACKVFMHYSKGLMYEKVDNYKNAAFHYRMASNLHYPPALRNLYNLSLTFLKHKDDTTAFQCLEHAATCGDARAKFSTGLFYEQGRGGVDKNFEKALQYYLDASLNYHYHPAIQKLIQISNAVPNFVLNSASLRNFIMERRRIED